MKKLKNDKALSQRPKTQTVSGDAPAINTSSSSVTTVMDGNLIDPAAANKTAASRSRGGGSKAKGGGGGTGGGVGNFTIAPEATGPSKEELKRRDLLTKLHPSLLAVVDRLKKNDTNAGADEAKFILNGKAEPDLANG